MSFSIQITEDINWQTYCTVGSSVHHNNKPVIQQGNYSSLLYQSKERWWHELFSAESHKPRSYSLIDKNRNRCLKTSHERGTNGNVTVTKHKRRSGNISQLYYKRKYFLDRKNTYTFRFTFPNIIKKKSDPPPEIHQILALLQYRKRTHGVNFSFVSFPGKAIALLFYLLLVTALKGHGGDSQGGHRKKCEERICKIRAG